MSMKKSTTHPRMNAEKINAPANIPMTNHPDLRFPSEVMTSCLSGHPPRSVPIMPINTPPTSIHIIVAATESPPGAPGIAVKSCPS